MIVEAIADQARDERARSIVRWLGHRSVVLVGLMGSGKTSVGKRLAQRLVLPFADSDAEIERAAGMGIPEMFATHGEGFFRDGERRVIGRLLAKGPQVLATGGGAFMNTETRGRIAENGVSVWLNAELDVLMRRVRRRTNRPLLQSADPEATMRKLMIERYPIYGRADITVLSDDGPQDRMVDTVLHALHSRAATADAL